MCRRRYAACLSRARWVCYSVVIGGRQVAHPIAERASRPTTSPTAHSPLSSPVNGCDRANRPALLGNTGLIPPSPLPPASRQRRAARRLWPLPASAPNSPPSPLVRSPRRAAQRPPARRLHRCPGLPSDPLIPRTRLGSLNSGIFPAVSLDPGWGTSVARSTKVDPVYAPGPNETVTFYAKTAGRTCLDPSRLCWVRWLDHAARPLVPGRCGATPASDKAVSVNSCSGAPCKRSSPRGSTARHSRINRSVGRSRHCSVLKQSVIVGRVQDYSLHRVVLPTLWSPKKTE